MWEVIMYQQSQFEYCNSIPGSLLLLVTMVTGNASTGWLSELWECYIGLQEVDLMTFHIKKQDGWIRQKKGPSGGIETHTC